MAHCHKGYIVKYHIPCVESFTNIHEFVIYLEVIVAIAFCYPQTAGANLNLIRCFVIHELNTLLLYVFIYVIWSPLPQKFFNGFVRTTLVIAE